MLWDILRMMEGLMFEMSKEELNNWRSQFATSNPTDKMGLRHAPFCFSKYGILMLSGVLNSERAIQVSIQIIEMFVKMRKMLQDNSDLFLRMEKLERNVGKHNMQIAQVFQLIKQFIKEDLPRKQIGFKPDNEYDKLNFESLRGKHTEKPYPSKALGEYCRNLPGESFIKETNQNHCLLNPAIFCQ